MVHIHLNISTRVNSISHLPSPKCSQQLAQVPKFEMKLCLGPALMKIAKHMKNIRYNATLIFLYIYQKTHLVIGI